MHDEIHSPQDKPKRPQAAHATKRTGSKRTKPPTPLSSPVLEPVAQLAAPDSIGSHAPQALPASVAPGRPAPDEPPIGERWGEFPSKERQAELKELIEAWEQEQDHGNRPGPFAQVNLTGADVYWLSALVTGKGDVMVGREKLGVKITPFLWQTEWTAEIQKLVADYTAFNLNLEGAFLVIAELEGANLFGVRLQGANLSLAQLGGANLSAAQLGGADLSAAQLKRANLTRAHLEGANLTRAHLEGVNLTRAHLEGANLSEACLTRQVDLRDAALDAKTELAEVRLDATVRVADVAWNGVPLSSIDWGRAPYLGDEEIARQAQTSEGERKNKRQRLKGFAAAARAYRQLAIALREQGIIEAADRFTYRAQVLQRELLWLEIGLPMPGFKQRLAWLTDQSPLSLWQKRKQLDLSPIWKGPDRWLRQQAQRSWHELQALRHHQWSPHLIQRPLWQWALAFIMVCTVIGIGVVHWWNALFAIFLLALLLLGLRQQRGRKLLSYLFSLFLAVLTGYGYRMSRIIVAYLLLIGGFATAYWSVGVNHPHDISFWTALIVSITAFHGRVFTNPFAPNIPDAQVVITAIEAIVGLVIEGVFIAMLTQRFFNR